MPLFSYKINGTDPTIMHASLLSADQSNYIMGISTTGGSDVEVNQCNIANGHQYSIISAFNIIAANGSAIPVLMIQNPWGYVSYNLSLS